MYCWGYGPDGVLGNGSSSHRLTPAAVSNISGVTRIAAGGGHACALVDSQAWCWGLNTSGQLGMGSTSSSNYYTPTLVYGISNATDIIAGYLHTCAINRGSVECWGSNSNGQLGFGSESAIVPFSNHVRAAVDIAP